MRLPRRSWKTVASQALPSIYTTFPTHHDRESLSYTTDEDLSARIEEGLELVPLEWQNTSCAKIFSPRQEEKEVVLKTETRVNITEKPLPNVPQSRWSQLSAKKRIFLMVIVQLGALLSIGLALMAVTRDHSGGRQSSQVTPTNDNSSTHADKLPPIVRGTFSVTIGEPQQQSSACIARMNESAAWKCTADTVLLLNILPSSTEEPNVTKVSLQSSRVPDQRYGQQDPDLPVIDLDVVNDHELTNNIPAYYFRTKYNRTVLLRDDELGPPGEVARQGQAATPFIQPMDFLWRCTFNETQIEGFIFINSNHTETNTTTTSSAANSTNLQIQALPYVFKLVEMRVPNSTTPFCERMTVTQNEHSFIPLMKQPIPMVDSAPNFQLPEEISTKKVARQESEEMGLRNTCRCQWMIQ